MSAPAGRTETALNGSPTTRRCSFEALGDRVGQWLTINEAKVIAEQGYQYGRMAPGKSDLRASGTSFTTSTSLTAARSRRSAASKPQAGSGPACNLPRATPRTAVRRPKLQRWLPIPPGTLFTSTRCSRAAIQTSAVRTAASPPVRSGDQERRPCSHCRTGRLPWRQLLHACGDRRSGTTGPTPSHLPSRLAADLSAGPP